jgi:hypothetical protein
VASSDERLREGLHKTAATGPACPKRTPWINYGQLRCDGGSNRARRWHLARWLSRQIGDLWNNWLMAVASSCGHAVASGVWCSARLVEVGRSKGKTKRSEAKRSTSGRSEREAGLPRARMHTHTHQRSVGSRTRSEARLRSLPAPLSSSTSHMSQVFRPASCHDAVQTRQLGTNMVWPRSGLLWLAAPRTRSRA